MGQSNATTDLELAFDLDLARDAPTEANSFHDISRTAVGTDVRSRLTEYGGSLFITLQIYTTGADT